MAQGIRIKTIRTVITLLEIETECCLKRVLCSNIAVAIIRLFTLQKRAREIAVLALPHIVAIVAVYALLIAERVIVRCSGLKLFELIKKRPIDIDLHLRWCPSIRVPVFSFINRECRIRWQCGNNALAGQIARPSIKIPKRPKREPVLPPTWYTFTENRNAHAFTEVNFFFMRGILISAH